ncbi:hypothetical protein D9M68_989370 [compost metagenome]
MDHPQLFFEGLLGHLKCLVFGFGLLQGFVAGGPGTVQRLLAFKVKRCCFELHQRGEIILLKLDELVVFQNGQDLPFAKRRARQNIDFPDISA